MGAKVLIIDDESEIRKLLKVGLSPHGYDLVEAASGQEGIYLAAMERPDIVILDIGLPDMEGFAVISSIREWSRMPIIILSVWEQENDKVKALDLGADDYLTKPFSIGELMARIRVALRHQANRKDEPVITIGELWVDLSRRQVKLSGIDIHLTPIEYDLLKILVLNSGKVMTHRHLLSAIWGKDGQDHSQYLRIYVSQLRKKIEKDANQPQYILTESGIGYRMADMD